MGDMFNPSSFNTSKKAQQTQDNSYSAPWTAQQQYILNGFNTAQGILNRQQATPFYSGETYANLNPTQLGALSNLNTYAASGGANVGSSMTSAGNSAIGGVGSAASNFGDLYSRSSSDPTQSNIEAATAYANNPATQGMIDAANRPIEQQLAEAQRVNNVNAAGTGNDNSSRAGTVQAILSRSAAQQEGDNAKAITGQQYNTGLGLAEQARQANLNAGISAAGGQLNAGSTGAGLLNSGYETTLNNLNIPLETGTVQQQNQQGADTNAYQMFQARQQYPWQSLDNYWGIVGNPSFGSQSSGVQYVNAQDTPSTMSNIIGMMGVLSDPRAKVIEGQQPTPDLMDSFGQPGQKNGSGGGLLGKLGVGGGKGLIGVLSDPRMKVQDGNTHGALDAVNKIGIKKARYKFDPPGTERPMMMAPQVQKVLPNAVTGRPNGPQLQTIKIGEMLPILVGAMKELNNKVENRTKLR